MDLNISILIARDEELCLMDNLHFWQKCYCEQEVREMGKLYKIRKTLALRTFSYCSCPCMHTFYVRDTNIDKIRKLSEENVLFSVF
jgi:hypothetical protein